MDPLLITCTAVIFCVFFDSGVADTIICGIRECRGGSPYCCELDDGTIGCCWDPFVYQMWWFWLIWAIVFLLILGCSLRCWRRRSVGIRYVVMNDSTYRTYGTVVHPPRQFRTVGGPPPPAQAYPPTVNSYGVPPPPPSAPVKPPSYAASADPNQKPPPYAAWSSSVLWSREEFICLERKVHLIKDIWFFP